MMTPEEVETRILDNERAINKLLETQMKIAETTATAFDQISQLAKCIVDMVGVK